VDWWDSGRIARVRSLLCVLTFLWAGLDASPERRDKPIRLAIVLDDAGNSVSLVEEIVEASLMVTIAILPAVEYARQCDRIAHEAGLEVMLHLPMEPLDSREFLDRDHSIFTGMTAFEVASSLCHALRCVPHARGVNNHMGSLATQDQVVMEHLMQELKRCGLFFLDSVCVDHSVAARMARKVGIPAGQRSVFLDNVNEHDAIVEQLEKLRKMGDGAVGIGHVRPETVKVLKERMPAMARQGVEWVFCSDLCETR